jgi:hypothetical protein
MTDDLTDIAGGDLRRARLLRDHLTQLTHASDPRLREMAKAVLNGEVSLRQASRSETYSAAISDAFNTFWTTYQEMSPEERAELTGQGYEHIERPS